MPVYKTVAGNFAQEKNATDFLFFFWLYTANVTRDKCRVTKSLLLTSGLGKNSTKKRVKEGETERGGRNEKEGERGERGRKREKEGERGRKREKERKRKEKGDKRSLPLSFRILDFGIDFSFQILEFGFRI